MYVWMGWVGDGGKGERVRRDGWDSNVRVDSFGGWLGKEEERRDGWAGRRVWMYVHEQQDSKQNINFEERVNTSKKNSGWEGRKEGWAGRRCVYMKGY